MSSLLWLLLYLAPLLGLTAALFAWFGWKWRGSDMKNRIDEQAAQIDTAQTALRQAEAEHAAAPPAHDPAAADELQSLREDLKSAQRDARLRQDEASKANEAALAQEAKMARLLADLEQLREEHTSAQAELDSLRSAPPAANETAAAPAKPKRKRSTPAKPTATTATLREKITALESQLQAYEAGLVALTQEREEWRLRVSQLAEQTPADAAGLGAARRSFNDSEKRFVTAASEIARLQNQTRVLLRVEETNAALKDVPDDDLTQIKGIKKIISEQLHSHGIRTWQQIAQWNDDELRAFSEILAFKNRAIREQWQQQARALHEAAHTRLL
ncbi:hypothetical protein [Prosthecobacter sp.]|uniref:hypothetical protein n=1 Tax=Prosthecobacter sp. TaxID=1965333 RepID=UPI002487EA62|nr:hypothetical protein [Prosthecobacter sp.]MDI1315167.1 hypothetical protein [Prosthecobacter sp.]